MFSHIRIEDFSYPLHSDQIAAYPLAQRDRSKLLVYRDGIIQQASFHEVADFLDYSGYLIVNNTRVVQARLVFYKTSGARIEIFCLEPLQPVADVQQSLGLPSPVVWKCMVGNAKKWKSGELHLKVSPDDHQNQQYFLRAEKILKEGDEYHIRFTWSPEKHSFAHILDQAGITPLPPYINRDSEPRDKTTYQTIFARNEGSVAAPTAGLHFTDEVFEALKRKRISTNHLTLHVGAGTFKPVSSATIDGHQMHGEQFNADRNLITSLLGHQGQVTSVGTTSMRTLESLYWIGTNLLHGYMPDTDFTVLEQWTPYRFKNSLPSKDEALHAILNWMDRRETNILNGETSLIIVPGYSFKMVDALITNFHQPRSTLLLLVAAFAGPGWRNAYQYALENGFRFLSYGDSCLFLR
jgi:S-adenosylmethionine:tRNA ribosyltransferase-isomerase